MKEKESSGIEGSRTQPYRNREVEYTSGRATTFKETNKLTREIYERLDKGDLVV